MKKNSKTFEEFICALSQGTPKKWKHFELAFVHSSFSNENGLSQNNERLEFLGDAVLGLCVGALLMEHYPEEPEGKLSRFRAMAVNEKALSVLAKEMELGEWVKLGKGETKTQGKHKASILADLFEAFMGAMYLTFGFVHTKKFIERLFLPKISATQIMSDHEDHKSQLQEYAQKHQNLIPTYTLIKEVGPDHAKVFTVSVSIGDKKWAVAKANSKKKAEQKSAKVALLKILKKEKS